jgi:hypothetical protein
MLFLPKFLPAYWLLEGKGVVDHQHLAEQAVKVQVVSVR